MQELRKLVHSPHHLFVFEVCGRLLSFTLAAKELGVSQPAISLAIRQLETSIGHKLFHRSHRQISLSTEGERLYTEVSIGLGRILKTAMDINRKTPPALVTLSVSTAFANYWILPRLSRLHSDHPAIDLRLQVVDKESDLENEDVSLSIRRGTGGWKGYESSCIASEEIIPVASAGYVDRYGKPGTIEELAKHQFIHLEEPYRPRPKWRDWFAAFDFDYIDNGEGLRLNDYALVIQAAMSGEGIAIGWQHIVASLISSGLLVQVMPQCWKSGEEFHLIWSSRTTLSTHAGQVRDWIINEARSTGELNRASPSSYLA